MPDINGFVTEESDPELWNTLKANWLAERKPGFVMRGQMCYNVFIALDIPKFKLIVDKDMYNDISMGG